MLFTWRDLYGKDGPVCFKLKKEASREGTVKDTGEKTTKGKRVPRGDKDI